MIDYHVHTSLCNHANGTMDQYIQNAIAAGLTEICFLDHLTLHESGKHLSMTPEYVPFYYQSVRQLAHTYRNHIRVKAGLEIDYDPKNAHNVKKIIAPFDFDVIGGSVHFIDRVNIVSSKDTEARENESIDTICENYLLLLDKMIENMDIDIICHLDIFKKFGRRPSAEFEKKFDEILSKISYKGLTVELNTSGYNHKANEFYPAASLLKKCHEKDIRMTLGSDAHQPHQVARHFDKAIDLLLKTGFRHVSAFTHRKPYDIPLKISNHEILKIQNGGAS
ncbi:MAG: histidinol-phosphatase [Desulfobacteraceae bacterium]|jgi:histidinol-phosphatase (PHP family)|nr:histidinol-phosphatase [Desulfobacteraceae bacterium]